MCVFVCMYMHVYKYNITCAYTIFLNCILSCVQSTTNKYTRIHTHIQMHSRAAGGSMRQFFAFNFVATHIYICKHVSVYAYKHCTADVLFTHICTHVFVYVCLLKCTWRGSPCSDLVQKKTNLTITFSTKEETLTPKEQIQSPTQTQTQTETQN